MVREHPVTRPPLHPVGQVPAQSGSWGRGRRGPGRGPDAAGEGDGHHRLPGGPVLGPLLLQHPPGGDRVSAESA